MPPHPLTLHGDMNLVTPQGCPTSDSHLLVAVGHAVAVSARGWLCPAKGSSWGIIYGIWGAGCTLQLPGERGPPKGWGQGSGSPMGVPRSGPHRSPAPSSCACYLSLFPSLPLREGLILPTPSPHEPQCGCACANPA